MITKIELFAKKSNPLLDTVAQVGTSINQGARQENLRLDDSLGYIACSGPVWAM